MDLMQNDPRNVIEADRAHVWHHLEQHKPFETVDPRIIVEGKGMKVWDITGKEHIDSVSGAVWTVNVGYGRESIANAVRDIEAKKEEILYLESQIDECIKLLEIIGVLTQEQGEKIDLVAERVRVANREIERA